MIIENNHKSQSLCNALMMNALWSAKVRGDDSDADLRARETGARALRAVLDEYMLEIMYELPEMDSTGVTFVIDSADIRENRPLDQITRDNVDDLRLVWIRAMDEAPIGSEDKTKIRRTKPVRYMTQEEVDARTVYVVSTLYFV